MSLPPVADKIQGRHRDRLAVVYVRQSTLQQVGRHPESTRLQYALAERAQQLGWARSARAYWRRVDSGCRPTCCRVDWRT